MFYYYEITVFLRRNQPHKYLSIICINNKHKLLFPILVGAARKPALKNIFVKILKKFGKPQFFFNIARAKKWTLYNRVLGCMHLNAFVFKCLHVGEVINK